MDTILLEDKKALSKDSSMKIVARSKPLDVVDRDRGIQELYPGHLQELDTTQIHQLNATYSSELENTQRTQGTSRGKTIPSAKNLKPLPRLPVELNGHPVTSSFEQGHRDWELDFIRSYQRTTTISSRDSPILRSMRR